jgi:hypothetical protein
VKVLAVARRLVLGVEIEEHSVYAAEELRQTVRMGWKVLFFWTSLTTSGEISGNSYVDCPT